MNAYPKNTISHLMIVVLLSVFLTSFPLNAATFGIETKEYLGQKDTEIKKDFSYSDIFEVSPPQTSEKNDSNYQLVIGLVKQKKFAQAKAKVAALIQQNPNNSDYYNLKAYLEAVDNDLAASEQSLQQAISLNNGNVQAYIALARLALGEKQYDKAKQYADQAVFNDLYAINAYKILAVIALKQQGMDAVEKVLLDAGAKVKGKLNAEVEILKLLVKVYASKQQPEKLLTLSEDLVARNKGNSSALSVLAGIQLLNKDIAGAEQSLRQIISQEPNDAEHRFFLAKLLSDQAENKIEVLTLLDQAAGNLENPAIVLTYKIGFLVRQNQYQLAFAVAKQVDSLYPKQNYGKILMGDVYLAENKLNQALHSYQMAYQITPSTKVLDKILKVLKNQNKQKDAIELLENELTKNKDSSQIQFRLAIAYQSAGNYDLSIKHYEVLLAKQADSAAIRNNLAWAYSGQQNYTKALELAEKTYQNEPESNVYANTYGNILLKSGNKQEGLKMLKKAAEIAPNWGVNQLHLAKAYIANQNKAQAKEILQRLIDKKGTEKAAAIKLMEQL